MEKHLYYGVRHHFEGTHGGSKYRRSYTACVQTSRISCHSAEAQAEDRTGEGSSGRKERLEQGHLHSQMGVPFPSGVLTWGVSPIAGWFIRDNPI